MLGAAMPEIITAEIKEKVKRVREAKWRGL